MGMAKISSSFLRYLSIFLILLLSIGLVSCKTVEGSLSEPSSEVLPNSASTEESSSEANSDISSKGASSDSNEPSPKEPIPEQVKKYLKKALNGSTLLYINRNGEVVKTIEFPNMSYSSGSLSEDGKYMLCKKDNEGGGEARWCGYTVVDLTTGEKYDYQGTQYGFQDHIILDNNLIGFADGSPVGGQEETWKPIQLFDMKYQPLDTVLDFDYGKKIVIGNNGDNSNSYYENNVTGIAYDKVNKRYILTYAKDLSAQSNDEYPLPFFKNRMGIAIFSEDGTVIDNKLLPPEYTAPFSGNIMCLVSYNPVLLNENWLITGIEHNMALINLNSWEVKVLPYSDYGFRLFPHNNSVLAYIDERYPGMQDSDALLAIKDGEIISTEKLPEKFHVERFADDFDPNEIVLNNNESFIAAYYWNGDNYFMGLFTYKNRQANLIHLLPSLSYCNMVGIDDDGNCLVLLAGATEQTREYYESMLKT